MPIILPGGGNGGVVETMAMDYKTYGTASYVYNNKDYLHRVYEKTRLSMNDAKLSGEALNYLNGKSEAGSALADVYGISSASTLKTLKTGAEIAANTTAMNAIAASPVAMVAVINSKDVMTAIAKNSSAMAIIAASSSAMAQLCANSSAMNIVASNPTTAMAAIGENDTAMAQIAGSTTALDALYAHKTSGTLEKYFSVSGKLIMLECFLASGNYSSYPDADLGITWKGNTEYTTYQLVTVSSSNHVQNELMKKYALFKEVKKYATSIKLRYDSDTQFTINYYKIS